MGKAWGSPEISDFVVYASNSVLVGKDAVVPGRDVGVRQPGEDPFLMPGFELALEESARVDVNADLVADSILLRKEASCGDVNTSEISNRGGAHALVRIGNASGFHGGAPRNQATYPSYSICSASHRLDLPHHRPRRIHPSASASNVSSRTAVNLSCT